MEESVFESLARLAMACDRPAAPDPALSDAHRAAFERWLELPAGERAGDLRRCLSGRGDSDSLLGLWAREPYYRDLAPARATRAEQQRFDEAVGDAVVSLLETAM